MDDFQKHEVLLAFTHRGRQIQLPASAKGWAQLWLTENPWTDRHRTQRHEYEQRALKQGHVAVNSFLRDWIKGQVTAIECGVLSFEAVFLPFMLTADGRTLIERIAETNLLPKPEEKKSWRCPTKRNSRGSECEPSSRRSDHPRRVFRNRPRSMN